MKMDMRYATKINWVYYSIWPETERCWSADRKLLELRPLRGWFSMELI